MKKEIVAVLCWLVLTVALSGQSACSLQYRERNGAVMNEESCGLFFVDDVQFQYSAASPAPGLSWVFVYPVRISAGIVEEYQGNRWEQIETSEADIKGGPQKVSYIRFGKIRYEKTYDELGIAFDPTEAAHEIELKNILEKMIRENVKPDTE